MRYFTSVLFLFLFTLPVVGQVTLKKEFDRRGNQYTIYNKFVSINTPTGEVISGLETWRVNNKRECQLIVSSIDHEKNGIRFKKGTFWGVERKENGFLFRYPNGENVLYKPTNKDPRQICLGGRQI